MPRAIFVRMVRCRRARTLAALLLVTALTLPAHAQYDSFELKGVHDVPAGEKPTLVVVAKEALVSVYFELTRDDGKSFKYTHGALKVGEHVEFLLGDGKLGRAHWRGVYGVHSVSAYSDGSLRFDTTTGVGGAKR